MIIIIIIIVHIIYFAFLSIDLQIFIFSFGGLKFFFAYFLIFNFNKIIIFEYGFFIMASESVLSVIIILKTSQFFI